ncbi:MAG: hypothetical protein ACHREM_23305 [Polyangiales bacterium]
MSNTDYVRAAVSEKATKDLATLDQRSAAFTAIDEVRDAVRALVEAWPRTAGALAQPSLTARLRKLRKAIDDAQTTASEIAEAIGGETRRAELIAERASIVDALEKAGIDASTLNAPGGDAQ